MICVTCGRKCHAASECRQPKRERAERPCFNGAKPGHDAKACKQPKAVHAVQVGAGQQGSSAMPPASKRSACLAALLPTLVLADIFFGLRAILVRNSVVGVSQAAPFLKVCSRNDFRMYGLDIGMDVSDPLSG